MQFESQLSDALVRLAVLREELKWAIDADAEAYSAVMKAYKTAKECADGAHLIAAAMQQAAAVPLGVAERAAEVSRIATALKPTTSASMRSDLTTAVALANAAIAGAIANVEINLQSIKPD